MWESGSRLSTKWTPSFASQTVPDASLSLGASNVQPAKTLQNSQLRCFRLRRKSCGVIFLSLQDFIF
jgi:hypothetical protein